MKTSEYRPIYNLLALTQDQKNQIAYLLNENLGSCGKRFGVPVHYADTINSIYRFFAGDMECHDEFDDEHDLTQGAWNVEAIKQVVGAFEVEHKEYVDVFKSRAKVIRQGLKEILNAKQYELLNSVFSRHFRSAAWYVDNYIAYEGQDATLTGGGYIIAKLSFMRLMGISIEDLKDSCFNNDKIFGKLAERSKALPC